MPRELVDFAVQKGCAPIDNFFDRPGMVNPPYAYGWTSGDKEDSAVFWCKNTEDTELYKLMFKVRSPKQLQGCPMTIEWRSPPGGLSIEKRANLQLTDFRDVVESNREKQDAVIPHAKVIVNYYDGLSDVFICYKGRWLVRSTE